MRQFYILSGSDVLSFQSNWFFHTPEGLGFGDSREYIQPQYGFFAENSRGFTQPNIIGEIIIRDGHYYEYEKLVEKLSVPGLVLVYKPVESRTLYMDIDVESIGLSECDEYGQLVLPVSLRGKTPYYTREPTVIETVIGSSAKRRMRFSFKYTFKFTQNMASDAKVIRARGHFPASLEAHISGPLSRPIIKAQDVQTGALLGMLNLATVSIGMGEQIFYTSKTGAEGVWKVSGNTRQDIFTELDIENNNFFHIPPGRDVRLTFSAETNVDLIKNKIVLHEYFKG